MLAYPVSDPLRILSNASLKISEAGRELGREAAPDGAVSGVRKVGVAVAGLANSIVSSE